MKEEDLALAQAMVAAQSENDSSGDSPGPIKRTLVTNIQNKAKAFR